MHPRESGHLVPGYRMPHEVYSRQPTLVDHRQNVVCAAFDLVATSGLRRTTTATTSDRYHPKLVGQLRGELIEHVARIPVAGEKHERIANAAPVERFNLDAAFRIDVSYSVRGRINPCCGGRRIELRTTGTFSTRRAGKHGRCQQ
jgi:hypothetical protein